MWRLQFFLTLAQNKIVIIGSNVTSANFFLTLAQNKIVIVGSNVTSEENGFGGSVILRGSSYLNGVHFEKVGKRGLSERTDYQECVSLNKQVLIRFWGHNNTSDTGRWIILKQNDVTTDNCLPQKDIIALDNNISIRFLFKTKFMSNFGEQLWN